MGNKKLRKMTKEVIDLTLEIIVLSKHEIKTDPIFFLTTCSFQLLSSNHLIYSQFFSHSNCAGHHHFWKSCFTYKYCLLGFKWHFMLCLFEGRLIELQWLTNIMGFFNGRCQYLDFNIYPPINNILLFNKLWKNPKYWHLLHLSIGL